MATFKALVRKDWKKSDGTYNVKIRIIHQRKIRYIPTPFYLTQSGLTKGLNIKDRVVIEKTDEEIKRLRNKVYELGFRIDNMDIDKLIYYLYNSINNTSLTKFIENKIQEMKNDESRNGTAKTYSTSLQHLLEFNNGEQVYFNQMTKSFVADFYKYLKSKMSIRSANENIRRIASMYTSARNELNDEELDIIIVKYHCFDMLEKDKPEEIKPKAFESVDEMQRVIDIPYHPTSCLYNFTKDMFVFSFICFGINIADILRLKKEDVIDGILVYRRKKTERRVGLKSEMQIKLNPIALAIIKRYNNPDSELLISPPIRNRKVEMQPLIVSRYIHCIYQDAGIESWDAKNRFGIWRSKYTFYTARHSMATFARNICKIDKGTVHEMLNHAPAKEFAITDVYIRRDYSHLWEANEKLLALFNWDFYLKQA